MRQLAEALPKARERDPIPTHQHISQSLQSEQE
jgi:hypothetical protein